MLLHNGAFYNRMVRIATIARVFPTAPGAPADRLRPFGFLNCMGFQDFGTSDGGAARNWHRECLEE